MNRKHREKIDLLIKFLNRLPITADLAPKRKGYLSFDTKYNYKKYCMLDKHIKLVAKCIDEGLISSDYFFRSFQRIRVKNYDGKLELFVLFPNSAKMMLFSSYKYKKVGQSFFDKFDFINTSGQEVNIDNREIFRIRLRPKESNTSPMFDFVGD